MNIDDADSQKPYLFIGAEDKAGYFSLKDNSVFDTGVNLSSRTIRLAHELGTMSVDTGIEKANYLLKTPDFANSVFADTTLSALGKNGLSFDQSTGLYTASTSPINLGMSPNNASAFYTSQSGTVPLNIEGLTTDYSSFGKINLAGGSPDISGILATGIAVEGVNSMTSLRFGTQEPYALSILDTEKNSTDLITSAQSIFASDTFQESYRTLKTDFIIGHKSDIEERVVLALENNVIEKKRANDLKEKELDIREREVSIQEKKETFYTEMLKKQQEILLSLVPKQAQLEAPKDSSNITLSFEKSSGVLTNSLGAKSSKISGQPLRLLTYLLKNKSHKCRREDVIRHMGGEQKHTGARNQLRSLIAGIARIDSIHNKENQRKVDFFQLVGVKD